MSLQKWMHCLRLNLRVSRLALGNRWLSRADMAQGYDAVAPTYDSAWLSHLIPTTDALIERLPHSLPDGPMLDLGCGTGHATIMLSRRFENRLVVGVDMSPGMLEIARRKTDSPQVEFRCDDMLAALKQCPSESQALVFSAWALGYSQPAAIIAEAARVLVPGGVFCFIVNRLDTLGPVFRAFRVCMARHPDLVCRAMWPRFPQGWAALKPVATRVGLQSPWSDEGAVPLHPPDGVVCLHWLLQTGVLAGFDAVLPLRENATLAAEFDALLTGGPDAGCASVCCGDFAQAGSLIRLYSSLHV